MVEKGDIDAARELVHLLRNVPFAEWPRYEIETGSFEFSVVPHDPKERETFFQRLKDQRRRIDNDLDLQIGRVRTSIELILVEKIRYFEWSGAPMRVAILLRKAKELELEAEFVEAFLSRMYTEKGKLFHPLAKRREKIRGASKGG